MFFASWITSFVSFRGLLASDLISKELIKRIREFDEWLVHPILDLNSQYDSLLMTVFDLTKAHILSIRNITII